MSESFRRFARMLSPILALMGLGWVVLLVAIAPHELGRQPTRWVAALVLSAAVLYIAVGAALLAISVWGERGKS